MKEDPEEWISTLRFHKKAFKKRTEENTANLSLGVFGVTKAKLIS